MLFRTLALLPVALLATGCIINVNGANAEALEHEYKELHIDAHQASRLIAKTEAGDLNIEGVDGLTQITVQADIYYRDLNDVELSLKRHGDNIKLDAGFDTRFNLGNSPHIDLKVLVPSHMTLDINDGSGAVTIAKVNGNIELEDGSGSIEISNGKNLDIIDGSGSLSLDNITGSIAIEDGSGSIEISQVSGNINIDDGSGSMDIEQVDGVVTINDGSGDIEVSHALGLKILESGSGDVDFDNINGPVSMH